ncbi:hypothetical protein PTSG_07057 [Salpingoeca rosetta]|uniref:DDE Tnp4 domain-containing protein n=1 Tax=Salpingoeca rosetta (strain ATCC 50818 / BSB-021) TaxID=946362 RepID=F2UDX4_SALR5|nr:uncharacterized protein PTSG_07057 [Salpingoeca rosetta]EGD74824.1 hypothetical protein PTSG_07057 [Salpingoeca rosetta]|eukprot:XP_004992469.1 hypothetical protein PTSG_07057 [Salpingoeca rosetta]
MGPQLRRWLTPYPGKYHPSQFATNPATATELFNKRHCRLRSKVERAIGILKQRFQILGPKTSRMSIERMELLILACGHLYNFIGVTPADIDEAPDLQPPDQVDAGEEHQVSNAAKAWRNSLRAACWAQRSKYLPQ